MTPRIITADEARVLRQKSEDGLATMFAAGASDTMTLAPRLVAHLCHTVEALHAEVARLQDRDAAYWSGYADGYGGGHTADTIRATVEALHAEVARLRALVREAYREGFAASDEMGWHSDDSASETRWLASAARAALEVTP